MAGGRFSGSLATPRVDLAVDLGNPFLNTIFDSFLKIGTVAATRVLAEDAFSIGKKGSLASNAVEHTVKKMCKEGGYWGVVGGAYSGMEYGVERIRGRRDWKNAMIGGAMAGALISVANNNKKDKILSDAITAAAIATACKFLSYC